MTDDDTLIRDRLAAAAAVDVVADPGRVREGVARRGRRIRRRRRGVAVLGALVVAGVVGAGVAATVDRDGGPDVTVEADAPEGPTTDAPTTDAPTTDAPSTSDGPTTTEAPDGSGAPRFPPAPGWEVVQVRSVTTASTIPMDPDTRAGSTPWGTVERLGPDDVALHVAAYPRGESGTADSAFPPGELPVSLDAMAPDGMEGDPGVGLSLRTTVGVDGWNLDLMAFFGAAEPGAETRARAQEQLARLEVPARTVRPVTEPPDGACQPADLRVVLDVEEAAGAVQGRIRVRNDGDAPCALEGVPLVELRDPTAPGVDVIPTATTEARPAWQQAGADAPEGWPTVRIDAGAEAQAVLTLRRWCLDVGEPFVFVRLPSHVDRIGGDAATLPVPIPCDDPQPPELAVGPFEPLLAG